MQSWITNRLTDAEAALFARDGFVMVRDAIDPARRARLGDLVAAHDRTFRAEPGVGPLHVLNEHDLIGKDEAWLELIDLATTFPKVFGILGWNIRLFHTQLIVTPPVGPQGAPGGYGWHQDNNRMNRDLETEHHPMISLKVGYFLTDLPTPGMGNLCVVPGSHRWPAGTFALGPDGQPEGAIEIVAAAGDAVVFDRRLWHSASTNCSDVARWFLTYGYAHGWLQPKSAMHHDELFAAVDPIRRQLLGATSSANGWYDPLPADVPLREWIREHLGADAVRP
jgi:hypothetical protein